MEQIKTQTIRILPEIHRLAKIAASEEKIFLQTWVENLILKEVKNKKEKSDL